MEITHEGEVNLLTKRDANMLNNMGNQSPNNFIPYGRISNADQLFSKNNNNINRIAIYHGVEEI